MKIFSADKEADFMNHLNEIFPANLFMTPGLIDFQNIDRHLQSLHIRLDRFQANPGKDSQKAGQLLPYQQKLHQIMEKRAELSEEARNQVFRFRDLVNEYRVSLFSPEIKTREPVSPKKLDQQWRVTLSKC